MFKKSVVIILLLLSCVEIIIAADSNMNNYPPESLNYSPEDKRRFESNGFRRVFLDLDKNFALAKRASKDSEKAVTNVEIKEGEALTTKEKESLEKETIENKINQELNINSIKSSYFNGFKLNRVFTHAMLNTQQDTGDPLFMLQARQQGILEDNYIYLGAKFAGLYWNALNEIPAGARQRLFTYDIRGYFATTITPWVSTLFGFDLFSDRTHRFNVDPSTIYLIIGNLSESPFFAYAANSTVMFGNFDIVSNFVPTLTRLFFMQTGGNINFSYHTQSVHLNAVLLDTNDKTFFAVTNAGSHNGVGVSLNAKYVYDMDTVGDYQFVGAAYTTATGFETKGGNAVGAFDVNYGISISKLDFEAEALITDSGVGRINDSSAVSTNNVSAGVPFFGSINPSIGLLNDGFLQSGSPVASWSLQSNYTYTLRNRRLIPYVDYSQIWQNPRNYAYQFGGGFRYNFYGGSWIGLDYTDIHSISANMTERQSYISLNYTLYL